jgi:hypothetical protein
MTQNLKYLSIDVLNELSNTVENNLSRYQSGDFDDLSEINGWGIELKSVTVDTGMLKGLEGASGAEAEYRNSKLVYEALKGMTAHVAQEDRIWTRLTHVECLEYSRKRWLSEKDDDSQMAKKIKAHFFADTSTRIRDDNAIARLWWNAYIATICFPVDPELALKVIVSKADIRSNFVERSWITSRTKIAGGIIRAMNSDSWVVEKEDNYRIFMKTVNKYGGGKLFEIMSDQMVDQFINQCSGKAKTGAK